MGPLLSLSLSLSLIVAMAALEAASTTGLPRPALRSLRLPALPARPFLSLLCRTHGPPRPAATAAAALPQAPLSQPSSLALVIQSVRLRAEGKICPLVLPVCPSDLKSRRLFPEKFAEALVPKRIQL